jgi:hypothetical protein
MSQGPQRRRVAIYLAAHLLSRLSDDMLLGDAPATEREMLRRSRELTRLLERKLLGRRRPNGENIIDLQRLKSRREVMAELGIPAPDRGPPRAA